MGKSSYFLTPEGSYKSRNFGKPSEIYFNNYWSPERNHSTIPEQVANVSEKNLMVVDSLTHAPPMRILEIACAPGVLLGDLQEAGFSCVGIEIDPSNKEAIQQFSGDAELHFGFFPEVSSSMLSGSFSNVIALDVIEHVEDGEGFLRECHRLLVDGGRLIIQAPILLEDGLIEERMFHEEEHIWIYSIEHLTRMLESAGFSLVEVSRWKAGHEHIVAVKREVFDEDYFMNGVESGKSNYVSYSWMPEKTIAMARIAMNYLGISVGESLLDFGASRGFFVKAMRELGVDAVGYDVSAWAVSNCHPSVEDYITTDASILCDSVDHIWSKDTLEHLPTEELCQVISKFSLASRKSIFIIVPLARSDGGEYIYPNDEKDRTHLQRRDLKSWCDLLESHVQGVWRISTEYLVKGLKESSEPYPGSTAFITLRRDQ